MKALKQSLLLPNAQFARGPPFIAPIVKTVVEIAVNCKGFEIQSTQNWPVLNTVDQQVFCTLSAFSKQPTAWFID